MADLVLPNLGEHLCVRSYLAPGKRTQVVVQRDDAILTDEELKSRWPAVLKAIRSELEAWVHHGSSSRKRRVEARNIIDVKLVLSWKHLQEAQTVQQSITSGLAQTKRVIKCRITIRGFKDKDARFLENNAGTRLKPADSGVHRHVVRSEYMHHWHK